MNKNKRMRTKTNSYTENQEEMHVQNMTGKSIDSYLSGRSVSAMACSSSDLVSLRRPFSLQKMSFWSVRVHQGLFLDLRLLLRLPERIPHHT